MKSRRIGRRFSAKSLNVLGKKTRRDLSRHHCLESVICDFPSSSRPKKKISFTFAKLTSIYCYFNIGTSYVEHNRTHETANFERSAADLVYIFEV